MRSNPDLPEVDGEYARRVIAKKVDRLRKKMRKQGHHEKDVAARKVPRNIRLENSRSASKRAKRARRANRR